MKATKNNELTEIRKTLHDLVKVTQFLSFAVQYNDASSLKAASIVAGFPMNENPVEHALNMVQEIAKNVDDLEEEFSDIPEEKENEEVFDLDDNDPNS